MKGEIIFDSETAIDGPALTLATVAGINTEWVERQTGWDTEEVSLRLSLEQVAVFASLWCAALGVERFDG